MEHSWEINGLFYSSETCDKDNGTCNFGCIEGFWDDQCGKRCGVGCSGNVCNRVSGICISNCEWSYYGQLCDNRCSKHCLEAPGRICDGTSGECFTGCEKGWFGLQCVAPCSENCMGNVCDRINGSCIFGCIHRFTGPTCTRALGSSEQTEDDDSFVQGLGAGLGVAVVAVAGIVVVLILRRRLSRSNTKSDNPPQVDVSGNLELDETSLNQAPAYQNLALDTTISPDHDVRISSNCTSTYQELNQNTRESSEYSTLDETK